MLNSKIEPKIFKSMKKNFYYLSLVFGVMAGLMFFTACSSDDEESPSNPLVGTWRAEVTSKGQLRYWDLTFTSDYKFSYIDTYVDTGELCEEDYGTYTVKNDTVTINAHGFGTSTFNISGDGLTFSRWDHGKVYKKIK